MSYIIPSTNPFVSVKLTQKGREQLAKGSLNFSYWAVGDSEINYVREALVDANPTDVSLSATSVVMRPVDREPNLKYFVKPSNTTNPLNEINAGVLNVIKADVNNEAIERGFFSNSSGVYTTLTGSTYTPFTTTITNVVLTGGTTLQLTGATVNVGDLILLKLSNTTAGNIAVNANTIPLPNLWYKVQATGTNSVTLDRNLPNFSSQTITSQVIVYRGGEVYNTIATGNTTAYWDTGTLSFDSANNITCSDVPVWNMNNVWCENIAGITGLTSTNLYEDYTKFGSFTFLGQKQPYFNIDCESDPTVGPSTCDGVGLSYVDDVSKSISILHYTNNTISNLYGEYFYSNFATGKYLKVTLPDLMYHRMSGSTGSGTTMGMSFIGSGTTKLVQDSDIQYIDLIEEPTMINSGLTANVVGRVFPQLKTVVFTDDEIVAAMSYKSNRNWTLPELAAVLQAPSGGTSTGVLGVNETMYLTYTLENNYVSGLTTPLSCQKYVKITNNTSSPKDVAFRINGTDLLTYMRKLEDPSYDGYGFYADTFKLLYQIVAESTTRPASGSWKQYDFTSTAITTNANETIDPKLFENQTPTITGFVLDKLKDNSATTYSAIQSLNLAPNTTPTNLQFGDERFFYGNLTTYIGATIYKTLFNISVNAGQFNSTTNPTRSTNPATNPPTIKITEVGIYDSSNNLVCIGKLSNPIPLSGGNTIMLELSMDF
jgi:hypothetical protein